nr:MAG TPA: hypothetical protein [Microviridae sp.]
MRTLKVSEKLYNQFVNKGFYDGRKRLYRMPYEMEGKDVARVTDFNHNTLLIAKLEIK